MIITQIRFENYRAYYGEVIFDFPIDGERNVSIIFANNDVGKTCFFSGVLFCLYGSKDSDSLKDLINVNAQREGTYQSSVTIFADQDGEEISITRDISLRGNIKEDISSKDFRSRLVITKGGVPISATDDAEKMDYINSIVHEDAAQYFFFDGEKINDYSVADGPEYREAIARILGIKEVENAIDDLKRIAKEYEKERDACLEEQSIYNDTLQRKKDLEQTVQGLEELDRSYLAEIQNGNALIAKHEEELKKFDEIGAKVARKQELTQQIKAHESELESLEAERQELFQKNATVILGGILFERFNRDKSGQSSAPYLTTAIQQYLEHLLSDDHCICGEPMSPEHRQHIQEYISKNLVTDESIIISRERASLFSSLSKYLSHGIESKNAFLSCCEAILSITIETNTLNSELLKLKRDIGSFNEEAGEKIQQDIQRVEKKIKDAEYRKAQNDFQLNDARQNLADLEALLAQYSQANNASAKSQRKLNYTQRLESTFENYLQQLLEEKRKTVEEKATEVFLSITNNPKKYRGIRINSDYHLLLELTDGEQYEIEPGRMLNPSTGQSKVISLSYIAGLNKSSNYAAPIIIDNPLGLFSDEHREAITNYLPHFGKQIIFMVSSGDLTDKYRQIIAPYVKTEYYLDNVGDSTWPKTTIAHKEVY